MMILKWVVYYKLLPPGQTINFYPYLAKINEIEANNSIKTAKIDQHDNEAQIIMNPVKNERALQF